ncbi:hypothetical protein BDV93DRAFT_561214 [Ceratobasidium sp. AG-I]|nr:hypothetical protein BDV93DRAFT_561214 [Ceratobasidium sp. AG-I]
MALDPKPTLATKRHPDFYFDSTTVVIQIENTFFNVYKYQLMKSESFSDMFNVGDASGGNLGERSSPENPIVMLGVTASDFEALLEVLCAANYLSNWPTIAPSLLVPAFRLVNMWNFAELLTYLLRLVESTMNDVDKIAFARGFAFKDWLAPAYTRVCQGEDPIASEEAAKIGVNGLLLIFLLVLYKLWNRFQSFQRLGQTKNRDLD